MRKGEDTNCNIHVAFLMQLKFGWDVYGQREATVDAKEDDFLVK